MSAPVYIINACRTPQAKSGTNLKDVAAPYLGAYLVRSMLDEVSLPDSMVDEVIFGNVGNPAAYPNIGRVIALEAGLDREISAYTVHRNCASGLEAVYQGELRIHAKRARCVCVGGVENMSQMPLLYSPKMAEFFINLMRGRGALSKLKALSSFRLPFLKPVIAIEQGLTDPFCGLNMGETAEVLSREMNISREEQDEFANRSHHLAVKATEEKRLTEEIRPILVGKGHARMLCEDKGPRKNSTAKGLGKMRPYFDKKSGTVTVGNSCPITDGGSALLLAEESILSEYNIRPMAKILGHHFHGLDPKRMGMGPLVASYHLLKRLGMSLEQMDLIEINEAFAAQVLAVRKGFKEEKVARLFGVKALGEIPDEKLNVNGGAIALGHPVGSTGSRLLVTLAHELKRRKGRYGLATLCIGGGQGGAVVIENLE